MKLCYCSRHSYFLDSLDLLFTLHLCYLLHQTEGISSSSETHLLDYINVSHMALLFLFVCNLLFRKRFMRHFRKGHCALGSITIILWTSMFMCYVQSIGNAFKTAVGCNEIHIEECLISHCSV